LKYPNDCSSGVQGRDDGELVLCGHALIDLLATVLDRGSSVGLKAKGNSMAPFVQNGDVLILSPGGISVGDVVAFRVAQGDRIAVHRVVRKTGDRYLIRGDCCSEPDGRIAGADMLARVSRVERRGKEVTFGLGPERRILAFLSGRDFLYPILRLLGALLRWTDRVSIGINPAKRRRPQDVGA
jgi:hypothetical protein